jgi:uncharacterized membrane protein YfcA
MLDSLFPIAYAQSSNQSFDSLFSKIKAEILNPIITLLFVLALVYFLWGVFEFIKNAESPEKRAEGGKHILFGLLGMFIMLSAVGIINLLLGTMGL